MKDETQGITEKKKLMEIAIHPTVIGALIAAVAGCVISVITNTIQFSQFQKKVMVQIRLEDFQTLRSLYRKKYEKFKSENSRRINEASENTPLVGKELHEYESLLSSFYQYSLSFYTQNSKIMRSHEIDGYISDVDKLNNNVVGRLRDNELDLEDPRNNQLILKLFSLKIKAITEIHKRANEI